MKGYKLWNPHTHKFIVSTDVVKITEGTQSCMENYSLVTDRTWLQLCVTPPPDHSVRVMLLTKPQC